MAKRGSNDAPQGGGQPRSSASTALVWGAIIVALVVVVSPETVILLAFGLLPAVVAFIIDRTPQNYAGFCVGGMNFCGIFSYILDLWSGGADVAAAIQIISDPYAILVIFSSAAFGWMLFMTIPPVVSTFLTVVSQRRVSALRAAQKELLEEWGERVANPHGVAPSSEPPMMIEEIDDAPPPPPG